NVVVTSTYRRSERRPATTGSSTDVSHSGCRLVTIGVCKKLYAGGGDGVAHSRPDDSHGFAPAASPPRQLMITFTTKTITDSAMMYAPIVATRLSVPHPVGARYV